MSIDTTPCQDTNRSYVPYWAQGSLWLIERTVSASITYRHRLVTEDRNGLRDGLPDRVTLDSIDPMFQGGPRGRLQGALGILPDGSLKRWGLSVQEALTEENLSLAHERLSMLPFALDERMSWYLEGVYDECRRNDFDQIHVRLGNLLFELEKRMD